MKANDILDGELRYQQSFEFQMSLSSVNISKSVNYGDTELIKLLILKESLSGGLV